MITPLDPEEKRELMQLYLSAVLFVLGCTAFAYGCGVYHGWY